MITWAAKSSRNTMAVVRMLNVMNVTSFILSQPTNRCNVCNSCVPLCSRFLLENPQRACRLVHRHTSVLGGVLCVIAADALRARCCKLTTSSTVRCALHQVTTSSSWQYPWDAALSCAVFIQARPPRRRWLLHRIHTLNASVAIGHRLRRAHKAVFLAGRGALAVFHG